jgi:Na(+)-translocating NADH:ubiquinone oxidoreductase A subunit
LKLPGRGFTPNVAGRPSREVVEVPSPPHLRVQLAQEGIAYSPVVRPGQGVSVGTALAQSEVNGGVVMLPSPASGSVGEINLEKRYIGITIDADDRADSLFEPLKSQYATSDQTRELIAKGGMWPAFYSSATQGMPMIDGSEKPKTLIVNFVLAEPFHARGRVVLTRSWDSVIEGIRFLPRLMDDYGKVEVILTAVRDPVARKMYRELSGFAWVRLHPVPVRYPVGDPRVLRKALLGNGSIQSKDTLIWSIDAQGIAQLGDLLSKGVPPTHRLVTLGGPGAKDPKHYSVTIGTPLQDLAAASISSEEQVVLRGGLLKGEALDVHEASVESGDDGFFALPKAVDRQSFSFLRPGFDRTSAFPAFAGSAIRRPDSHITATLRGEERPCISCGMCEEVCPVRIMPQVIHRYLHRDMPEEAVKAGLELCIDCNLCSFVCPSKIELQGQFSQSREQLLQERLEAAREG